MVDKAEVMASYIGNLYIQIEQLIQLLANYVDELVYVKAKYEAIPEIDRIEDEDRKALQALTSAIRMSLISIRMKVLALAQKFPAFKKIKKDIEEMYNKMIEEPLFERKDIENYISKVQEAFIEEFGETVVEKISQAFDRIYPAMLVGGEVSGGEAEAQGLP